MADLRAGISAPSIMRQITLDVKVTGVAVANLRIWLGCKVMMIAAVVMGCSIKVDVSP